MRILVIQQKMIGDVLASSIICNNLRLIYPDSNIDYLVYPFTKPVVENNPNIDRIILFEDKIRNNKFLFFKFLMQIKRENYDIVIDAYGKIESNLISLFSGANRRISVHKKYTSFIYTDTIKNLLTPKTNAGLAIENRLLLIKRFNTDVVLDNKPKIFLTPAEIENGKKILEKNKIDLSKKVYMIGVLGSSPNKTYPFEYMARILDTIVANNDATLLFNYIPSQSSEAKDIFNLCVPKTQQNVRINVIPGSIREFLSITYHCNALIGNEGGAVNMAKALNKPTFTIFSTWIEKEAWNAFDNQDHNISVHLKDFKPELYGSKGAKKMKSKAFELSQKYTPDLIIPSLEKYLKIN